MTVLNKLKGLDSVWGCTMAQLLRKPSLVGYISQRFQQTQAKVAKVSFKEPHQPLGRLAVGPVFKNARLFPDKVAIRDRIAGMLFFWFCPPGFF